MANIKHFSPHLERSITEEDKELEKSWNREDDGKKVECKAGL